MPSARYDNIDQFVIETVFKDNGAVKGFTILEQKQRQVIQNNKKVATSNREVANSGFALGKAFKFFASYFAAKDILQTVVAMDSLNASFASLAGSAEAGANEMNFLRQESERLGLDFQSVAKSYKGLFAAGQGAGLSKDFIHSLFGNLMQAGVALQSDKQSLAGALLAIEQMISKGAISMQELRQQLGNALPGAMQIAAKSMGVTTAQLEKMLSKGMDSVTFLKAFNTELSKQYGNKWQKGAESLNAELNRLNNALFDLKVSLAQGGVISAISNGIQLVTKTLQFLSKNISDIAIIIAATFLPSLVKAIPLLDLFFLNIKSGMGIMAAFRFAVIASLPAMKGFAVSAWAMVAPFLKIYLALKLVIEAIKALKGEENWFSKLGEAIANFWHHGSFEDETYEERMKRLKIWQKTATSKGEMKPVMPAAPVAASRLDNKSAVTSETSNSRTVNQDIKIIVNGAQSAENTAEAVKQKIANEIALGVMS